MTSRPSMTAADDFKIDYRAAARDALNRVQQELVTKEIEQKVRLELENENFQEQLNTFEATEFEETKAPSSLSIKINVISGQRFGMVPQGSKIQSLISVAGHQVIRNLSEPSEFTLMHLNTYADYLRQVEPRTESRAVRALLTTGGPRMKKRNKNRSHRASGHRSGSECDADKNLGKNGLHAGRSNSNESPTGRRQSRSYLRSRKNTNNGPPHGRTGSLDELPGGREFGRCRPIHLGQRFCQEF